ncbi:hypothetical protein BD779DRAFT_1523943 [Infundibulicybe gibba]|nr:hypothetical protein BD779DRAFT_1523943 [Infundibulicybe gibba]
MSKRPRRILGRNTSKSLAEEDVYKKLFFSFSDLPLDTLIHIQLYLEPNDILALRQCCKSLSNATRERSVWISALRRVCREYNVFEPTFPIDRMTLNELESTSTSPSRFSALLWHGLPSKPLQPAGIRILKNSETQQPLGRFYDSTLLPGGRFLITRALGTKLHLWDLGHSPAVLIKSKPLATITIPDVDSDFELLTQLTDDGLGIHLLIVSMLSKLKFHIYEIYPLSMSPEFRLIATFCHPRVFVDAYVLTPTLLAFHGDESTVVWNFISNTWAKWVVDDDVLDIIIHDTEVMMLQATEFSIYKIPPLHPYLPETDTGVPTLPRMLFPILRVVCPVDGPAFSSPSHHHCQQTQFDVIGEENGDPVVSRYTLQPIRPIDGVSIADQNLDVMPRMIPVRTDTIPGDDIMSDAARIKFFQLPDVFAPANRIICWLDDGALKLSLSVMPHQSSRKPVTGVLYRWPGPLLDDPMVTIPCSYSFCPMSGRLCVSSWEGEIRVLDYVMPAS